MGEVEWGPRDPIAGVRKLRDAMALKAETDADILRLEKSLEKRIGSISVYPIIEGNDFHICVSVGGQHGYLKRGDARQIAQWILALSRDDIGGET